VTALFRSARRARLQCLMAALAGAAACTAACTAVAVPPPDDVVTLSIVGTTDVHGAMSDRDGRGGLPLLGGYVDNLRAARAADGGGVVLVDAGDMFQGTLESNVTEGAAMVAAYNAIGYTAAAIGNHEFDFGPAGPLVTPVSQADDAQGALKARAAEARFPFLTANVVEAATGAPVAWPNVFPSTLVTVAGVRVGIVGATAGNTPQTTIAANLRGLTVAPLAPAIAREAAALRMRGASVVIVTAHEGGRCREFAQPLDPASCDMSADIVAVAKALPKGLVDVIVGGHTHSQMAHRIADVYIMQAGASGAAFVRADVRVNRATAAVAGVTLFAPHQVCAREDPATSRCDAAGSDGVELRPSQYEGRPVAASAAVVAAMQPALARVEAVKRAPVGVRLVTAFPRVRLAESALGNMFADAVREAMRGDVAILNGGGIRTDLPAGTLTYGQLYETFPFENRLVVLDLTGAQLAKVLANNLAPAGPVGQIMSISGVRVTAACKAGTLAVTLERPSGRPIADGERLRVVLTDFVLAGGDALLAPVEPVDTTVPPDAPLMRDAIAMWLSARGGELRTEQFLVPAQRRWVYSGDRPVRCN
jgi:5'-nucleotidase